MGTILSKLLGVENEVSEREAVHCTCCVCRDQAASKSQANEPTAKPFPFLDLPPELRARVFNELLVVGKVFFKGTEPEHAYSVRYAGRYHYRKPQVNLLRVCKTIHQEAEPLYLSKNLFILPVSWHTHQPFCIINPFIDIGNECDRPLFSQNALIHLENLSLPIDANELQMYRFNHAYFSRPGKDIDEHSLFSNPRVHRANLLHDWFMEDMRSHPDYCVWWWGLVVLVNMRGFRPPHAKDTLGYVEFDFSNAYCIFGCCRPVRLIKHDWFGYFKADSVHIIGWKPYDDEKEVLQSVIDEKVGPEDRMRFRLDEEGEDDPWACWKLPEADDQGLRLGP